MRGWGIFVDLLDSFTSFLVFYSPRYEVGMRLGAPIAIFEVKKRGLPGSVILTD